MNTNNTAIILVPDLTGSKLPEAMRKRDQWLNWIAPKLKADDPSRYDKVPVGPSGFAVNAHDPENHRTFHQAAATFHQVHGQVDKKAFTFDELVSPDRTNKIAGIAFDLPKNVQPFQEDEEGNPLYLVGLDWDRVISEGKLSNQFKTDLSVLSNCYRERSPSGTGVRAFALTREPVKAFNKNGFECYSSGRFLTITGHGKGDLTVVGNEVIENLKRQYGAPATAKLPSRSKHPMLSINKDVLDTKAYNQPAPPLAELLEFIPTSKASGCSFDVYTKTIWAARATYGHIEETKQQLIDWSQKTPDEFDENKFEQFWSAEQREDGVGAGTLIFFASQHGWQRQTAVKESLKAADGAQQSVMQPAPIPLGPVATPVQAFTPELMPAVLNPWVLDIANRLQCPADFPAVGAIVAISSLIGARAVMAPKSRDDWRVVPNLWGLIVGRPSVMKSPALGQVLAPLTRLEAQENERWLQAIEEWDVEKQVAELAAEAATKEAKKIISTKPDQAKALLLQHRGAAESAEPQMRRYLINDATVEKLGELLQQTPWGTLVYRDEIYGLLTSMDKQGQEGARSFYLQAYDGNQGYTYDRIGRGTLRIERVCFSLLGGIQPGRVEEYVRSAVNGGSGDDGLLQRFGLTVWPDVTPNFKYVDQWPDNTARQAVTGVFDRLNALQPGPDGQPLVYRFTEAAQDRYAKWMVEFETEIRGPDLHPALVAHLSKYRKLIPALALIFTLIDKPQNAQLVDTVELERALAWGRYLRSHAERLYSVATKSALNGAAHLLEKLKAGKLSEPDGGVATSFTPRIVASKNWTGLTKVEAVTEAADLLVDHGWLTVQAQQNPLGGRPSVRYLLHPDLL